MIHHSTARSFNRAVTQMIQSRNDSRTPLQLESCQAHALRGAWDRLKTCTATMITHAACEKAKKRI
jgi:hypothetical protein